MAKNNMNFSVSLNLLTKNFQKGIRSVQNSLRGLRNQFQTLLGGIGMGLGFQELIDNAKSLDKVQTTLKNVSGDYEKYGENMRFVSDLSKRYNQDLITLTGNYAKFYSAASYAGFALEEQQHIYESLTRASAYFNLTADETNGVMLAVQQMISKGKVSSEELRRQLGERLPGAMNLAAKAMGVTTAELDKMIRDGRVMATELLPLLASELDGLTANLKVDTIQGAINKLKNSFTELVDKMGIGDIYKRFLNGVSGGLDYISDNLKKVGETIAAVLGALFLKGGVEKGHNAWNKFFKNLKDQLSTSQAKAKVLKAELLDMSKSEGIRMKQAGGPDGRLYVNDSQPNNVDSQKLKEAQKLAQAYNQELRKSNALQTKLNNKLGTAKTELGAQVKNILKMVGIQAAYYAIAAVISTLITLTVKWLRKTNEVKRKLKEIKSDLETDLNSSTPDISKADSLRLSEEDNKNTVKRERKIKEINKLLGRTGDLEFNVKNTNDEINAALEERIKNLKKVLELEAKEKALTDLQQLWNEKAGEETTRENIQDKYNANEAKINAIMSRPVYGQFDTRSLQARPYIKENKQYKQLLDLYDEMEKIKGEIADIVASEEYNTTGDGFISPDPDKEKKEKLKEDYDKIQKEYNDNLRILNDKHRDGIITQDEYDKALKDLTLKTLDSIYALDGIDENTDVFAKALKDSAIAYMSNEKKQDKANEALQEYYEKASELKRQYIDGIITMEQLDDELYNLREETVKAISSMGKLSESAGILADLYKKQKADRAKREIGNLEAPEVDKFDTTLNYKKSNSEIYGENAEYIREYADELRAYIDNVREYEDELSGADLETLTSHLDELETQFGILTQKADSFAQAATFAEVQEDIKNLKTELAEGIWDNITGIASAAERLTNSFKSMTDTLEDPDASGWEKFLTVFTTIISTIETIVGVVKAFQTAMAVAESLSLATTAAEQAGIPVKMEDAVATQAQAAASKELAVARHMAAAASVPYPANLAAIASTSAALAAAFAAIPAFAHGGFVKGSSTVGDRNLIRANAGELVLTKGQQGTLWSLLNGQTSALSKTGNVEFKIKGSDLVGTLNNYSKKISK